MPQIVSTRAMIDQIKRMCGRTKMRGTMVACTFPIAAMPRSNSPDTDPSPPVVKDPQHIDDFLMYRMHNLTRVATRGVGLMFRRDIGISRRDWRLLAFVGRFPHVSLTRLSQMAALDTVIASRGVAALVERKLIAKSRLPSNKRLTVLTLTEAGQAIYDKALEGGRAYNMELASCLTDAEAHVLDTLLSRLETQAAKLTARQESYGTLDGEDG
ncbi:DNA-binding MarR family transcriptional regulator [Paraburkholderia sp. BL27I4N3]|nr:DNA-binding MarR family transcriptional regulator [Paraburkholderia sp. BL27I4N3]